MMPTVKTIQKIRALFVCVLVVFCFGATGEICGFFFKDRTTAFGSRFPDNKVKDIKNIMSKMRAADMSESKPDNPSGNPMAVLVVKDKPRALVAIDLATGKTVWKKAVAVNSELSLGDDTVMFKSANRVVAYSITTGQERWDYELDEGWDYYGSDVSDGLAAISIGVGGKEAGGYANGKVAVVNAKNGLPIWSHGAGSGLVGEPVVVGSMIFIPWNRQKIVIIDIDKKEEICRVRAEDYSMNFIKRGAGGVYFGNLATKNTLSSIVRFNENAAAATLEGATAFTPKVKPVPGIANFARDGFAPGIGGRSTEEKKRFHWSPNESADAKIAMQGNKYYLHYWKYIFAFDAQTDKVVWTYKGSTNIESVDVIKGGHVIGADSSGRLFLLDAATGAEAWTLDAGEEILAAVFDANGFNSGIAGGTPSDPAEGLKNVIFDNDNRMLPIRAYATGLLAAIPKPEITRDLLEIYSSPKSVKLLKDAIVEAVETRTMGAEYMVEALNMKYDYLEQTQPPPMRIVAPALINMKEKDAVPGLLRHLMNHETPIENIAYILAAIQKLGDESVVEPLMNFLTLYHADSAFLGHEDILSTAASIILKFGEKETAQQFIIKLRHDLQTLVQLRAKLREVLDPAAVAKERAERKAKEEADKKAQEEAERKAKEAAMVPETLTRKQIGETIIANQQHLKPCIIDAMKKSPELKNIRLRFLLAGETGEVSDVRVLPNNIPGLNTCLEEAFTNVTFRKFKKIRQMATYTISIKSENDNASANK